MDAPASLIVGSGWNMVILSPAGIELGAVHLFTGGTSIAGRDDCIVLIHDYCAEIAPKAGALVSTPRCQIQKILVPVGSH